MSSTGQTYSPREDIMRAFAGLFPQNQDFVTVSRKLVIWGDTSKEQRPCLFLHELDDDVAGGTDGRPQVQTMHVNLFIYTWAKELAVPSTILNQLIDSVFAALAPNVMTGKNNLGLAFVDHCWVSGKVFKDPGDLDGDGLAIIPVSIRMTAPVVYPIRPPLLKQA